MTWLVRAATLPRSSPASAQHGLMGAAREPECMAAGPPAAGRGVHDSDTESGKNAHFRRSDMMPCCAEHFQHGHGHRPTRASKHIEPSLGAKAFEQHLRLKPPDNSTGPARQPCSHLLPQRYPTAIFQSYHGMMIGRVASNIHPQRHNATVLLLPEPMRFVRQSEGLPIVHRLQTDRETTNTNTDTHTVHARQQQSQSDAYSPTAKKARRGALAAAYRKKLLPSPAIRNPQLLLDPHAWVCKALLLRVVRVRLEPQTHPNAAT